MVNGKTVRKARHLQLDNKVIIIILIILLLLIINNNGRGSTMVLTGDAKTSLLSVLERMQKSVISNTLNIARTFKINT